ncbi:MAG: glycoside hydrolase family 130 protein [Gemmatimonadota bacterium]|mgnify:CR=1 FL=1
MTLVRSACNPILTRADIPPVLPDFTDMTSVFNPGAIRFGGKTLLMLRVQSRGRRTALVMAESDDGVRFSVGREPVRFRGIERAGETLHHLYDPRITRLGDTHVILFAADTETGCKLGAASTTDFETYDFIGLGEHPDIRNGVLFPEKIGGRYARLDRPNRSALEGGVTSGDEIWFSTSDDLVDWKPERAVMAGRWHYWDERIGSGPPPVKTRQGWLHLYHGIATHFAAASIYQVGVVLLDLADPSRLVARSWNNILEPREPYEMVGQVPNVVFPGGMIVERTDAEGFALPESPVHVYYGAADTCVGLATTTVRELIEACDEPA